MGGGFSERIRAAVDAQRQALVAKAAEVKSSLGAAIAPERQRVVDGFGHLLQQMQDARGRALQDVVTRGDAAKQRVREAATTERANLDAALLRQQSAARQAGETAAQDAIHQAATEGERMAQGTAARAQNARNIGARWSSKFAALDGAGDLASQVRSKAEELARTLEDGISKGRQQCTQHGETIAAEIRKDAGQVASGMADKLADARARIEHDRDDAIKSITDGVNGAQEGIGQTFEQTRQQVEQKRSEASQGFEQLRDGALGQVDAGLTQMNGKLDELAKQMQADIDGLVKTADELNFAPEVTAEAHAGIERTANEYVARLGEFGSQGVSALGSVLTEAGSGASAQATQILAQTESAAAGYKANLDGKVSQCVAKLDESADSAVADMRKVTPSAEKALSDGVTKGSSEWHKQLTEKIGTLRGRVDEVLSTQDKQLNKLDQDLAHQYEDARKKAEDSKKDKPWYDDVIDTVSSWGAALIDGIKGFVVGFFEAALELLKGLWDLLKTPLGWLLLALVVILVVIVVVLVGWEALIIAGLILGILMASYYIYLAVTTPGLSPYERGKLFGHAAFELLLGLAGVEWKGSQLLRFTEWGGLLPRAVRLVQEAGSLSKAAELYRLIGNLERTLQLIEKLGSAEKVIALVNKVGGAERLSALFAKCGDVEKLVSLLGNAKVPDAATLERLLGNAKIPDAATLERLLGNAKIPDAATLEELLRAPGMTAEKLEGLLALQGMSATELKELLQLSGMTAQRLEVFYQKLLSLGVKSPAKCIKNIVKLEPDLEAIILSGRFEPFEGWRVVVGQTAVPAETHGIVAVLREAEQLVADGFKIVFERTRNTAPTFDVDLATIDVQGKIINGFAVKRVQALKNIAENMTKGAKQLLDAPVNGTKNVVIHVKSGTKAALEGSDYIKGVRDVKVRNAGILFKILFEQDGSILSL